MSKGILKFKPATNQEKPLYRLEEAFEVLVAAYVNEHEGRKSSLAVELLRLVMQKCVACLADGREINMAAIERCKEVGCPLHHLGAVLAAGVETITGDKEAD